MEQNDLEFIETILKQRKRDLKTQKYFADNDTQDYKIVLIQNMDICEHRRIVEGIKNEINSIDKIIKI